MFQDLSKGRHDQILKQGENMLNQRKFSVESLTSGEYLTITVEDLDKMKRNF